MAFEEELIAFLKEKSTMTHAISGIEIYAARFAGSRLFGFFYPQLALWG
jgi:hypothetical protein